MKNFTLSWVTLFICRWQTEINNKDFVTSDWQFQSVNKLAGRLFAFQMPTANFHIHVYALIVHSLYEFSFSFSKTLPPINYYWQARIKKLHTDVDRGTGHQTTVSS